MIPLIIAWALTSLLFLVIFIMMGLKITELYSFINDFVATHQREVVNQLNWNVVHHNLLTRLVNKENQEIVDLGGLLEEIEKNPDLKDIRRIRFNDPPSMN